MSGPRFPTQVILYRHSADDAFAIGAVDGAEHALGFLDPDVEVRKTNEGAWVFVDPEQGQCGTTTGLPRSRWEQVIPRYPLELAKVLMQNAVRRHVWSALVFRLILCGVRNANAWRLELVDDQLVLRDADGESQAVLRADDWWFAKSEQRAHRLAGEMVDETGLEPLSLEHLLERFGEENGV